MISIKNSWECLSELNQRAVMRKASAGYTLRLNAYLLAYRDHPITYPKVFGKLARLSTGRFCLHAK